MKLFAGVVLEVYKHNIEDNIRDAFMKFLDGHHVICYSFLYG